MTHRTLTTALALALTVAATAGAQSTERGQRPERPRGAQQDNAGRRGRGGPELMLLRGITLSADQQAKLADLQRHEREQFDANRQRRDGANGRNGEARPQRQRGDTTGMAARRAEFAKRFEQRIAAVREILTADQRVQFDKNVAEMKARRADNGGRFGGAKGR
jgi:Spy/CpxP family protein refolding chaperone